MFDQIENKNGVLVCVQDNIFDRMTGEWRRVARIERSTSTLFMDDGGVMGADEVRYADIRLDGWVA